MTTVAFDCSALDPSFKSHAHRGIGRYVSRLKEAFERRSSSRVDISYFDHASLGRAALPDRLIARLPAGRTPLRQHILYPSRLGAGVVGAADLIHYPAHMDAPAWSSKPYVLTVLDLIPHLFSEMYRTNKPTWRFRAARALETRAIRNATLLIAISEATANDITRLLGIPRERIVVTPLGVDTTDLDTSARRGGSAGAFRERLGIPSHRPILLYVGGHDERKNIDGVIGIARRVIDQVGSDSPLRPVLVLAGRVTCERERERLVTALSKYSMERDTVNLGFVQDEDLSSLYSESSVFLFPTLYEGFGLPALEAMAAGLPVVCSNTSSLPEVVGDAGVLFEPLDLEAGAQGVLSILTDESFARTLSVRGVERAAQFTWERTAVLTEGAYLRAQELLTGDSLGACPPERGRGTHEARAEG